MFNDLQFCPLYPHVGAQGEKECYTMFHWVAVDVTKYAVEGVMEKPLESQNIIVYR